MTVYVCPVHERRVYLGCAECHYEALAARTILSAAYPLHDRDPRHRLARQRAEGRRQERV